MQIIYLKNQYPACAGQYANDFIPKKSNFTNIDRLMDQLQTNLSTLNEM